ncbi:MAG TPA: hypothetical protein VFW27_11675 [Actinoplanes sp.]|jgi:NO-binding membrane sensor protein with MHYT domain|nr:hypothetical protein [Actinoplanes sp.]
MSNGAAVAVALVFVWLGMVLGISFLEAPLKFRAPGVTLPIGLSIGRLVFRALNAVEVVLAAGIAVALVVGDAGWVAFLVAAVALVVQLFAVRPALTRRSNAVLEGQDAPRSRAHYAYVGLEIIKVVALIATGVALF